MKLMMELSKCEALLVCNPVQFHAATIREAIDHNLHLLVEKPFIGSEFKDPGKEKIQQACKLMVISSWMALFISCFILFIF